MLVLTFTTNLPEKLYDLCFTNDETEAPKGPCLIQVRWLQSGEVRLPQVSTKRNVIAQEPSDVNPSLPSPTRLLHAGAVNFGL